jgi:hypothetical protein
MPSCIGLNIYAEACDEKPMFAEALLAIKETSALYHTFPQQGDFITNDDEELHIVTSRQWHEGSLTIWAKKA